MERNNAQLLKIALKIKNINILLKMNMGILNAEMVAMVIIN